MIPISKNDDNYVDDNYNFMIVMMIIMIIIIITIIVITK